MRQIVLATKNRDKIEEIGRILDGTSVEILTLEDFPDMPDVIEDGGTLEANAEKKATEIAAFTRIAAVADDTGLEVDALGGRPGVRSSRYSGENATYYENVSKLLSDMAGIPEDARMARFRTVVALYNGRETTFRQGVCEGRIAVSRRGEKGFGYDPVFLVPAYGMTFAEMDLTLKNELSHRGKAFEALRELLNSGFDLTYREA